MDILGSFLTVDVLFLALGAGCLGLGAALVQIYRNSTNGFVTVKQRVLLATATASLAAGPILIYRGW